MQKGNYVRDGGSAGLLDAPCLLMLGSTTENEIRAKFLAAKIW